jgi:hypothetical protein
MESSKRIILKGRTKLLKPAITQLMATYHLLRENMDRGLYTMPVTTFQDSNTFTPQIKLVFYQFIDETKNNNPRVNGEITYRIVGETEETFTKSNARVRAQKIKTLFTEPELFVWQKGKEKATYLNKENGYDFRLYVKNESEARRIITQVMAIENKFPDWDNLRLSTSSASYPEVTGTKYIYGKQRRLPRRRPLEDIKFRYAELHLWGLTKPVTLIDTFGNRGKPLVRV